MEYKILKEAIVYKGFNTLRKVEFEADAYDHSIIRKETEVLERGDSCAAIIYEQDTQSILFTEQFRMPVTKHLSGWLTELVAGRVDGSDTPEETIIREIMEEIGYVVQEVELIAHFYVSPGVSTERIFLYYSEVDSLCRKDAGGGLKEENEDIKLIKVPVSSLKDILKENGIKDAKSILGIQWFLMNKYV